MTDSAETKKILVNSIQNVKQSRKSLFIFQKKKYIEKCF